MLKTDFPEKLRTFSEETRTYLSRRIEEICHQIAAIWKGRAIVTIDRGYSVVQNDLELFHRFSSFATSYLGRDAVHTNIDPSTIAEDFSAYGQYVPTLYMFFGCQCSHALHSSCFIPHQDTLQTAIALMSRYFLEGV